MELNHSLEKVILTKLLFSLLKYWLDFSLLWLVFFFCKFHFLDYALPLCYFL